MTGKQRQVIALIKDVGGIVLKYTPGNYRTARSLWVQRRAAYLWTGSRIAIGRYNSSTEYLYAVHKLAAVTVLQS